MAEFKLRLEIVLRYEIHGRALKLKVLNPLYRPGMDRVRRNPVA
jgi:hypothetical protein